MIESWQAPLQNGTTSEELLVKIDHGRNIRVLILPALFDEANKLRRFTVELMRALDRLEIDSFLPWRSGVPIHASNATGCQSSRRRSDTRPSTRPLMRPNWLTTGFGTKLVWEISFEMIEYQLREQVAC